jgi:AcrR family transcriptional regulator
MSKKKILDAAARLFSELGYHRTSMDDIAKESGVAKGTLYYHFSGKGDLFESIVVQGYQLLKDRIEQELHVEHEPSEQVEKILNKHIELFLQYNELVQILSNELTNGIESDILQRIGNAKQDYLAFLSNVLRTGQEDEVLVHVNSELAAAALLGMIESATMYYVRHRDRYHSDELYDTIQAFVKSALLK